MHPLTVGTSVNLSPAEWVLLLVLSLVWAFLGYRLSEQARITTGRTPWGIPSLLWAFFWFLSLVLGLVLYVIYLITRAAAANRQARAGNPHAGPPVGTPPGTPAAGPVAASHFPAYPRPANSGPSGDTSGRGHLPAPPHGAGQGFPPSGAVVGAAGGPGFALAPPLSPPGWHPDPSGRFHYRWWTGGEWTPLVSLDGHTLTDTSPDQRIGPYPS